MATKKEELELIEEINKKLETQKLTTKEVLELDKQRQELLKKWEQDSSTQLQNSEENLKIMKEYTKLTGDQAGLQDLLLDVAQKQSQVELEKLETLRNEAKELGKMTPEIAQQVADQEKILETAIKQEETLEKQNAAMDGVRQGSQALAMGLFKSREASGTFAGQLFLAAGHAGGVGEVINSIGKGLASALKPANLMAGLFHRVQMSTKEAFGSMDNFRAELAKSGASLEQYGDLMTNTTNQTIAAGVGMKDAQQSILALHAGMSSFNTMSEANQQTLTNTTATMSKLGVDAQTSAGNLETLTKSLGMNAKQADIATKEIAATAQALGVSQQKMASDFASAGPQLAAHGEKAVQVFRKMAAQSKATGVAMGSLLSIAGQFDTFEGAAEAAGKLNAVLGTQLNSIDLLTASEDERIRMLQDSVAATGKSFDSMNKFEKQALAAAAGISDVNEAAKIFGTTSQQMDKAATSAEKMALANKELQERAASASTAQEKINVLMERFAVAVTPAINFVHMMLDGIMALDQALGGAFIPTMFILIGVMFALSKIQQAAIFWSKVQVGWNMIVTRSIKAKTDAEKDAMTQGQQSNTVGGGFLKTLKEFGEVLSKNAKGFLAFGAAMLMVGAGIGLAALGMAEFVKAFAGLGVEQLIAVTLGLLMLLGAMVAIAALMVSGIGPAAVIGLLAFGAAFLLIGAGVALAGIGMAKFVTSIVGLSAVSVGIANSAIAVGTLTYAILTLASALALISTEDLQAVAAMAQGFGSITVESAVAFGKAMTETKQTVVAMAQEPEAARSLTTVAQAFSPTGTPATQAAPATATAVAGGGDNGNRTIVLKIDKKVFGQAVINIFEKEQNLNKLG